MTHLFNHLSVGAQIFGVAMVGMCIISLILSVIIHHAQQVRTARITEALRIADEFEYKDDPFAGLAVDKSINVAEVTKNLSYRIRRDGIASVRNLTCINCCKNANCRGAFDYYNTDGACIMEK